MDKVIDWIAADIARAGPRPWQRVAVALGLAALGIFMAFALRGDFVGVFTWAYLLPAGLMLVPVIGGVWWLLSADDRSGVWLIPLTLAGALMLTLPHPGAPDGFHYASVANFWLETGRCFWKGLVTSSLAAIGLSTAAFVWLPLPDRRVRWATGAVASMVGLLMLNLHCMSPDYAHIMLGHWAPAIPLVVLTMLTQRWWIQRVLRRVLPDGGKRLRGVGGLS